MSLQAGPWRPAAVQPPTCNNPAPALHPNGTWFLLCGSHTFVLLRAASLAEPWERVTSFSPIVGSIGPHFSGTPGPLAPRGCKRMSAADGCAVEDPVLFIDRVGRWHVVYHAYNAAPGGGSLVSLHHFSRDGISWKASPTPP
eukprot:SAG22_NODE_3255_length_1827_cov_1.012153_1_plen_141_part_10